MFVKYNGATEAEEGAVNALLEKHAEAVAALQEWEVSVSYDPDVPLEELINYFIDLGTVVRMTGYRLKVTSCTPREKP